MRTLVTMVVAAMMLASGAVVSYATEDFLALTNADRSKNGLTSLTIVPDLQAYAQGWAETMMRAGRVSHSADLGAVTNSRLVGENVGRGPILGAIESAFMASPVHQANILESDFSEAGVGVVWDGVTYFYVAVIFRQGATAAPPPPAAAEPKPAPAAAEPPPAAAEPEPAPLPRAALSPPPTGRPQPTPAPPPAISPPAKVPPSPEPARIEHPAPLARQAGPRLSWVLAATTGKSVAAADAHDGAGAAPVVAAGTGSTATDGSASLLLALALLGVVYASTRILAEAHRRLVSGVRS